MEAYIQAAEQIKEDIAAEYLRSHPHIPRDQILNKCPSGKTVFGNIEIALKNSAKYKLFSQRVQGQKRSILEGDELLYSYLTTSNDESYNDSLESAKCCKKLSYFLFTSRYEKYTLVERNLYSDRLHKHENRLPGKAIDLYNTKKSLIDLMDQEKTTYHDVHNRVIRYVGLLNDLLDSQSNIYEIELKLAQLFQDYLDSVLIPQFIQPGFKMETVKVKALIQSIRELRERGLDLDEIKESISTALLESVISVLSDHMDCLRAEIHTIGDVTSFLTDIVKYADPPEEVITEKGEVRDTSFLALIRSQLPAKIADWLFS